MPPGPSVVRRLGWLGALYLALLLVQLGLRAPDVPWTIDNGIKWLASAHGEGGLRAELPYAGRGIDPEARFFPIGEPFVRVIDGKAVSQYPPTFALVSRPFVRMLGALGGFVLPLLGALLAAWGAARLAAQWDEDAALWAFLFAGPLGPLAWYGTQFWEHTLVASCVAWAAVSWPGRRGAPIVSALLLALGTWMREETVLFVPALMAGGFAARWRPSESVDRARPISARSFALFVAVYCLALVPFLAWQRWSTGSALGFHFSGNLGGSLSEVLFTGRAEVVRGLLWSGPKSATGAAEMALTIVAALCVLGAARLSNARARSVGFLLASAFMGAVAANCARALITDRAMPMTLIHTSGLLLFAPWVLAALAGSRASATSLMVAAAVALVLVLLVTPSITAFALHWGPRVLLSALPLLAAAAALGVTRLRSGTAGIIPRLASTLLVVACLALQVFGGWIQARVTKGAAEQLQRTRSLLAQDESAATAEQAPESARARAPIVTSEWWYAGTYAPLLVERPVFRVTSRAELTDWIELYRRAGGHHFWWATAAPNDAFLQGLGVHPLRSETIGGYPAAYRHRLVELALD
jgi:hypothetical protein